MCPIPGRLTPVLTSIFTRQDNISASTSAFLWSIPIQSSHFEHGLPLLLPYYRSMCAFLVRRSSSVFSTYLHAIEFRVYLITRFFELQKCYTLSWCHAPPSSVWNFELQSNSVYLHSLYCSVIATYLTEAHAWYLSSIISHLYQHFTSLLAIQRYINLRRYLVNSEINNVSFKTPGLAM